MGYLLSGISHGTIFSLLYLLLDLFSSRALVVATATIAVRASVAFFIDASILKSRQAAARLWLLVPGDLLTFAAWVLSFAGKQIRWRGTLYRIADGGRLVELGDAAGSTSSR